MDRKQILRALRERYVRRQVLNLSAVKREAPELVQAVYQVQPYWGWKQALADAGISYDKIRVEVRETVVCKICGESRGALPSHLAHIHYITSAEYLDEYPGAELVSEAVRARMTGRHVVEQHPDYLPHWEPIYTAEYVLDRLHAYAQLDYSMDFENLVQVDCGLSAAVRTYLECSWDDALRRIGLNPIDYRGLTRDDDFTLEQFRQWLDERERGGLVSTCEAVLAERDEWGRRPRIAVWALKRFGNWAASLEAAGVDMSKPCYGRRLYLSAESVVAEIQRLHGEGADVSHVAINLRPDGSLLTSAGSTFFGTWEAALDRAGVPAENRRCRPRSYRTRRDVLAAVRRRLQHGFGVKPLDLTQGLHRDLVLWRRAFHFFGTWRAAVKEAGATAAELRQASGGRLFPTADKVIEELQRRSRAGRLLARRELSDSKEDKHLYAMALGFFGRWQAAVIAAGEDPKAYHQWNLAPQRKYLTADDVLAAIRDRRTRGLPLNSRGLTDGDHRDVPLLYTARQLFGSWPAAIEAAGLPYDQVARKRQDYEALKGRTYQRYETEQEVVRAIRRRRREGRPVTYRALSHGGPLEERDYALVTAGKRFFGSWDAALREAGVDPADVQAEWVPRRQANLRRKRGLNAQVPSPES